MKKCNKCKKEKEFSEFHKSKTGKYGVSSKCKECVKEYYEANKERIIECSRKYREANKGYYKEYYEANKERIKEYYKEYREANKGYYKEYYEANKEKIKEHSKEYYEANKGYYKERYKEYHKKYQKERRKQDPLFKLRGNISSLICISIKNKGYTKKSRTYEILGCTYDEFKEHIESQFTKGMSWDNQGEWHLDHIYPVSLAKSEEELIALNHYTNFQPLWAEDNLSKSNKIENGRQIRLI